MKHQSVDDESPSLPMEVEGVTRAEADSETLEERKLAERRRQLREAQQRAREKRKAQGDREIRITLTSMEWAEFERLQKRAKCGPEAFPRQALLLGARFTANSGQGKKPSKRQ